MDEIANVPKLHIDDAWDFQPWSVVEQRLQNQISAYKSAVAKYCERTHFDLGRMRPGHHHHQWLALYQCCGMSPAQIRDWDYKNHARRIDRSAVTHAVRDLAERIGLDRRPERRGPTRLR